MLKKNKTAGAAKKSLPQKSAAKRIINKTVAKKRETAAAADLPAAVIAAPIGKKYIAINEPDPELQKKYRLVVAIVALAAIFLVISWFFSLRYNVGAAVSGFRGGQIKERINNLLGQSKNDAVSKTINQKDLDIIRQEIVKKINSNINSSTWPVHQSEILGLQVRYPNNWNKQEITDTLILSSYPLSATAPSVFGQVKIKKVFEPKNSLTDYLTAEQKNNYQIDSSLAQLSGWPAIKYAKRNTGADISWIVIIGQGNKIFEIELYSQNGQGLYEKLFTEILATIKF